MLHNDKQQQQQRHIAKLTNKICPGNICMSFNTNAPSFIALHVLVLDN